jgi:hypothetical protein
MSLAAITQGRCYRISMAEEGMTKQAEQEKAQFTARWDSHNFPVTRRVHGNREHMDVF